MKIMTILNSLILIMVFSTLSGCTSYPIVSSAPNKFRVDKKLFPYQSRYMKLENGAKIHYVDEGKDKGRPTLLLLHGHPTWSFLYRKIIAELKEEYRLIAPDYPGFGLSTAPKGYTFTAKEHAQAMNEFVQKLNLQDTTIMMQDWGGPIGFDIALKNPERINGFIIGNTWAWPLERMGQKGFSLLLGGWPGQFVSWCCTGVPRLMLNIGVENKLSKEELTMYMAPFKYRSHRSQAHIFPAQLRDARKFLEDINKNIVTLSDRPALIVWGMKDFAFQEPERSRFELIFTNHKTVLLENAGHFIQEDAPKEIAVAISNWHKLQVHKK